MKFYSAILVFILINFGYVSSKSVKRIAYATFKNNGEITIREYTFISGSYSNDDQNIGTWAAKGVYKQSINETGFAVLNIESNSNFPNEIQSYAVGVLESFFTGDLIYGYWYNTVRDFRKTMNQQVINNVDKFLKKNLKWLHKQIRHNEGDIYWHHLSLYYNQVRGMFFGYNKYWADQHEKLKWKDMMWLNIFYDLLDLYNAFGGDKDIGDDHCSVLIKIMPNNSDVYIGHNTWTTYQTMLRIMKKYKLNYYVKDGVQEIIPGSEVSFSSYPGTIGSLDDFYLISSGLAVTETTNQMFNKTLWFNSLTSKSVFQSVRSVIANRLADSGNTWSHLVSLYNSGTYNNQWMIFDYKKFKPGQAPRKDAFWVVEQAPTISVARDLTDVLINKGYWISYNVPYFQEIYDVTDYNTMLKKYGNWFSHELAPRAQIFKRDQYQVKDMDSFMNLMRSNDFKKDPFARCFCEPPYSAAGAIAARDDLNPINGTYQFKGQSHNPSGATDAKISNYQLFLKLQFVAISGPSTGTKGVLPVFQWSTSGFNSTPHLMHPDTWNFNPVLLEW